jgi:GntR family transcriptional repressor for pyruvate dehydrogenase complex
VVRSRVSSEIVQQVRDLIVSGRATPGDRLPGERQLAATIGVGRSTVREALRVLESLGVVLVCAGKGAYLAESSSAAQSSPPILELHESWEEQRLLVEVRRIVEPPVAALAVRRATAAQIAELERVLVDQAEQVAAYGNGRGIDRRFHLWFGQVANNRFLTRMIEEFAEAAEQSRQKHFQLPGRPRWSLVEHRRILQAVKRRDPALTQRRMDTHLRGVQEALFGAQVSRLS